MHRDGSTIVGGHALDADDVFICEDCGSVEDNDAYKRNTPEGDPLCRKCGDRETQCELCEEPMERQFITYEDICTDCAEEVAALPVHDEPRHGSI